MVPTRSLRRFRFHTFTAEMVTITITPTSVARASGSKRDVDDEFEVAGLWDWFSFSIIERLTSMPARADALLTRRRECGATRQSSITRLGPDTGSEQQTLHDDFDQNQ